MAAEDSTAGRRPAFGFAEQRTKVHLKYLEKKKKNMLTVEGRSSKKRRRQPQIGARILIA